MADYGYGRARPRIFAELWDDQQGICPMCLCRMQPGVTVPTPSYMATFDHIVPRSRGGSSARKNMQLLCSRCNQWKGASPIDEAMRTRPAQTIHHEAQRAYPTRPAQRRPPRRVAGASYRKVKKIRYQLGPR